MTLMRFDPFREVDRLSEQLLAGGRARRMMPMEAFRRGDNCQIRLDMPGVMPEDVEVTVERNVVSVRATRRSDRQEADEVLVDETPKAEFSRQLFLGENLDAGRMSGELESGVLTLTVPVAEESKPKRVEIGAKIPEQRAATVEAEQAEKAEA
jgi:HSP20 family protein